MRDLKEAVAGNPNANLRLKIKQLLLKYHPDHRSTATLNNEEVTRDLVELLEDARTGLPAATEHVQDQYRAHTGRARCRRCRRRIEKGATRVEICAFVRPGRRTLLLRCADCVDARFAAAVLAVHGRAERVPVEAALVGSAEALRVQRAIDAASGGGG